MKASYELDSSEIKDAIVEKIKAKMGISIIPAESNLFVKFDDVTKNVLSATLTVKKD
jgi:hypothetical protein